MNAGQHIDFYKKEASVNYWYTIDNHATPLHYDNSDNNPDPTGDDGDHGTSVAGIIASVGWNNKGGRGVAPSAKLVGYNLIANTRT